MAKIVSVNLLEIPEVIVVNDNDNDITVLVDIQFHDIDIKLNMEYYLHLFVYDVHGSLDIPLVIPNWDECEVKPITLDRQDDFLGTEKILIIADKKNKLIKTPMQLKLGKLTSKSSHFTKKLEVFATLAPLVGRASKWSKPFESKIEF